MKLVVTGGAGFIGSAFVRYVLSHRADVEIVTLDKLTYAGNLENLEPVAGDTRHHFVQADICDEVKVAAVLAEHAVDVIVHFAAESHVDRSILSPACAIDTNVCGTATLLAAARVARIKRFLHVSTDEVYGDIDEPHEADETYPLSRAALMRPPRQRRICWRSPTSELTSSLSSSRAPRTITARINSPRS